MFDVRRSSVSFPIRLAVFQARGGARVKLHEIQCPFREVPHTVTDIVLVLLVVPGLVPRPYKILIHEHYDEEEKNQIRSHAYALRPQPLRALIDCF
jgi:hypothetical protein